MATSKNTSTNTLTDDAGTQLRKIADQLDVFSDVLMSSLEAIVEGGGKDSRTVAYFAVNQIGAELTSIAKAIYAVTAQKGGAA